MKSCKKRQQHHLRSACSTFRSKDDRGSLKKMIMTLNRTFFKEFWTSSKETRNPKKAL